MNKETYMKGMAIFLSVFRNIETDENTFESWFILLKDLEDERFEYAIKRICQKKKDFGYTANFVAIIREYAELYVYPERKKLQSHEQSDEYRRLEIEDFKRKLKYDKGIDYDALGDTEYDKFANYCRIILRDSEGPLKQSICDITAGASSQTKIKDKINDSNSKS